MVSIARLPTGKTLHAEVVFIAGTVSASYPDLPGDDVLGLPMFELGVDQVGEGGGEVEGTPQAATANHELIAGRAGSPLG